MIIAKRIKSNVAYRNLANKVFDIEFEVSKNDVIRKANEGNWACYNFIKRRKDFNTFFDKKLYYGKVDGLGYIISEDELE